MFTPTLVEYRLSQTTPVFFLILSRVQTETSIPWYVSLAIFNVSVYKVV